MTQQDEPINEKVERIETIIEQLEVGEVTLAEAQDLYAEGQGVLEELQETLDIGDGEILER
jgi:exodeoxyribonuclease VII small subunit